MGRSSGPRHVKTCPWRRPIREYATEQLPDRPVSGDVADEVAHRRWLIAALDALSPRERAVIVLRHYLDLPEAVSLLNKERANSNLYVSLVESSPTAYYDDKTLPSLPSSVLNVMQAGRAPTRSMFTSPETASEQMALPFDYVVTGSYSLRIHVK